MNHQTPLRNNRLENALFAFFVLVGVLVYVCVLMALFGLIGGLFSAFLGLTALTSYIKAKIHHKKHKLHELTKL